MTGRPLQEIEPLGDPPGQIQQWDIKLRRELTAGLTCDLEQTPSNHSRKTLNLQLPLAWIHNQGQPIRGDALCSAYRFRYY